MHLTEARHCQHCPCIEDGGRCCYCQFTRSMLNSYVSECSLFVSSTLSEYKGTERKRPNGSIRIDK